MSSVVWFFAFLAVLVGLILLFVIGAFILEFFLSGGFIVLIGLAITAGAVAMIMQGGPVGGLGIFVLLLGIGAVGFGGWMLKDWFEIKFGK